MEERKEKLAAECGVTRTAGRRSLTSEMEAELLSAEVNDRKEEGELSNKKKKQSLDERTWNRRDTKMEGGRKKPTAKSGVTRTEGSGSQTPEMEAEHLSVGANYRQRALEVPAKSEAGGKVLPLKEAVDCSQKNKGIKEVTVVKIVQSTEMNNSQ